MQQPLDVRALTPNGRVRWVDRMPHVVGLRVADDCPHALSGHPQPRSEIVVLATPTDVLLVESVHGFQIAPRDRDVETHQFRLERMAPQLIAHVANPAAPNSPALGVGNLAAIRSGDDIGYP